MIMFEFFFFNFQYSHPHHNEAQFQWCKGESASNGGDRGAWLYKTEDIDMESGKNSNSDNMEVSS